MAARISSDPARPAGLTDALRATVNRAVRAAAPSGGRRALGAGGRAKAWEQARGAARQCGPPGQEGMGTRGCAQQCQDSGVRDRRLRGRTGAVGTRRAPSPQGGPGGGAKGMGALCEGDCGRLGYRCLSFGHPAAVSKVLADGLAQCPGPATRPLWALAGEGP